MVMNANNMQLQIPNFNVKNYDFWYCQMKFLFRSQKLWNFKKNGYSKPMDATTLATLRQNQRDTLQDNWKKDKKALLFIV